jgi:CRISPR-associated helicase Cas3
MTENPRKPIEWDFDRDAVRDGVDVGSVSRAVSAASSPLIGSTTAQVSQDSTSQWLREALGLPAEDTPFPWQEELLKRFTNGTIERSLDIPTGLGKTAVMPIWLVARAHGAALPRRLVYIVDRRAVVDQATDVAKGLRAWVDRNPEVKRALGLRARSLPISTLRG